MIKNILQKGYIGISLGLIILFANQVYAKTETATLKLPTPLTGPVVPTVIQHLAFSNDSSQILYISDLRTATSSKINVINAETGEAENKLTVKGQVLGFMPDGLKTAALELKGLSILNNKTNKVLRTLKVPSLSSRPRQYRASWAITNKAGTAQVLHSENKRILYVINTISGVVLAKVNLSATLHSMGVSQDGRTLAYVLDSPIKKGQLNLYNINQKKVIKKIDLPNKVGNSSHIHTIFFSPRGKFLRVNRSLIDLTTDSVNDIVPSTNSGYKTIFTPNGRFLFTAQQFQILRYDLSSKQPHWFNLELPSGCMPSSAVDISPNGKFIAYGSHCYGTDRKFISILSAVDGSFVKTLALAP